MTLNRRRSDPGFNGRITIMQAFYQLRFLWWLGGAIAIMFGFDFKTPARHFKEIEAKAETVSVRIDARMTAVEKQHEQIEKYLGALSIAMCIDRPKRDTALMGLPCDSLLQVKH